MRRDVADATLAAPAVPLLGVMVTVGDVWVIRSWLNRHAWMFEEIGILDGSQPGSRDAEFMRHECGQFPHVRYGLEADDAILARRKPRRG